LIQKRQWSSENNISAFTKNTTALFPGIYKKKKNVKFIPEVHFRSIVVL
jgi:hypothetical protein